MALIEFKNKPDTTTPINANDLNYNFKELLNLIYPIGAIMIRTDNIDYSDYLGFEWERTLVGKTPVGIDYDDIDFNIVGQTGGEKKHTLVVNELPEIKPSALVDTGTGNVSGSAITYSVVDDGIWYGADMFQSIGENQAHNNLQPYEVVAFWKRIA